MKIKTIFSELLRMIMSGDKYARYLGVKVGKNCSINRRTRYSTEPYLIEIGDCVKITSNVKFFTHGGVGAQSKKSKFSLEHFGRIKIGNYTFIGDNCLILPGVTIGNDVIVGAGTVVSKSIPDGVMVAGNPMRYIGKTEDFISRVSQNCVMDLSESKRLKGRKRREFIESIPDEKLDHKKEIKIS